MRKDVDGLNWDLFEQNGNVGYYLMYRALYDSPNEKERRKRERERMMR